MIAPVSIFRLFEHFVDALYPVIQAGQGYVCMPEI